MASTFVLSLSCLTKYATTTIKRRAAAPAFLLLSYPPRSLHTTQPFTTSSTTLHGRGGGGGKGEDKLSKGKKKGDLPEKMCVVCGRPFTWRAKWAKVGLIASLLCERAGQARHIYSVSDKKVLRLSEMQSAFALSHTLKSPPLYSHRSGTKSSTARTNVEDNDPREAVEEEKEKEEEINQT